MSRKLFAFLLSELKTVRISCPHCAAVTEVTIEQLGLRFDSPGCPVCRRDWHGFVGAEDRNLLNLLGRAIHMLQSAAGAKHVEFVLPDNSESDAKK